MSSKYAQRMLRLSQKIFGEYRRPEMPSEIRAERVYRQEVRQTWNSYHLRNESVIRKLSALPLDLDCQRNPKYYPPHPQYVHLINRLRDMGLFRDEHLDFKEEMIRQRIMRGKPVFERKGSKKEE